MEVFDLRCLVIPPSDRSTFEQLLDTVEVRAPAGEVGATLGSGGGSTGGAVCAGAWQRWTRTSRSAQADPPVPPPPPRQAILRANIDADGRGRPVYLLGESFGGLLALALAERLGGRVDRLVGGLRGGGGGRVRGLARDAAGRESGVRTACSA
jgi:hypothetical protein